MLTAAVAEQLDDELPKNRLNVTRAKPIDGTFRAFKRPTFDCRAQLDVKFIDEFAIDAGGPRREALRLAMKAVRELPIFGGPSKEKVLVLDGPCKYPFTGRIILMASQLNVISLFI